LAGDVAERGCSELLHGDHIRPAMQAVATGKDLEALQLRPRESDHTQEEWITELRKRDTIIWRGIREIIADVDQHGEDIVAEGNIWPDFAAKIAGSYALRAAFIIDTNVAEHTSRLHELARADDTNNNWMRDWDEDRLNKWAPYNVARSLRIAELAEVYGFPVFDIADNGITAAQIKAASYLLAP
ncbi:MAG: hypothetical protein WA843_02230, partial [Candidatus Saccharimonadales bacterium]